MADVFMRKVKIWDLPTRLFHWSLVLLVAFSFVTGEIGGVSVTVPNGLPDAGAIITDVELHMWSGLCILALVLFRIAWGLFGSATSQFANFVRGPGAIIDHARHLFRRGASVFTPGHNPAGAVMIVLVLILLLVQAGTGLFLKSDDDFIPFTGPLNGHVSVATAKLLHKIHGANWTIILLLVLMHVVAILYYWLVKRENLIPAMFTGKRVVPPGMPAPELTFAPTLLAALMLAVAAAVVWAVVRFG